MCSRKTPASIPNLGVAKVGRQKTMMAGRLLSGSCASSAKANGGLDRILEEYLKHSASHNLLRDSVAQRQAHLMKVLEYLAESRVPERPRPRPRRTAGKLSIDGAVNSNAGWAACGPHPYSVPAHRVGSPCVSQRRFRPADLPQDLGRPALRFG